MGKLIKIEESYFNPDHIVKVFAMGATYILTVNGTPTRVNVPIEDVVKLIDEALK